MSIITYTSCTVCSSKDIRKIMLVKDFSVSQKEFEIWECNACTLRFTQNIPDQQSIGQYYQSENYISHTDIHKGAINRLYHIVRRFTLAGKRKLIERTVKSGSGILLDVGAGTGAFAALMQQNGWQVTGVEPNEMARQAAKQINAIDLIASEDFFKLPAESFDVITLWHVLEHVHDLHGYLNQLKKLLKPGGFFFIAVPNYTSVDAGIYKEYWAAYDVPRHLYHFSPASMDRLLQLYELKIKNIKPMWFDSFYVSLLSEKYKTGKPNLIKGCWNGFISDCKALFNKQRGSSVIYIIPK